MNGSLSDTHRSSLADMLVVCLWAGCAFGLLEALETFLLRGFPAISPYHKSGVEVFWIAPLADTLLFGAVGLLFWLFVRLVPQIPGRLWLLGIVSFLGCDAVLSYPRVIQSIGEAMLSLGAAVVVCRAVRRHEDAVFAFLRARLVVVLLATSLVGGGVVGLQNLLERHREAELPPASPRSANVLVIVVDTLRGDRLSSVGYARPTTPHIDAIAREGVLFENAFSTAPWTLPSHNTMLTGMYTYQHQADYPVPKFRADLTYLPQVLARQGYRTGLFSGNLSSVDEEYLPAGFLHYATYTISSTLTRMSLPRKICWQAEQYIGIRFPPPKRAERVNRELLRWLDQGRERPFFALVNYVDVHDYFRTRWRVPPPFRDRFGGVVPRRRWIRPRQSSPGELELLYDEALAYSDAQIGELFDQLRQRGLDQNTLVVITGDHGEAFWEHGLNGHASTVYPEELHVPLVLRFPGRLPAGARNPELASLVAMPATILDLLGLPNPLPDEPLSATRGSAGLLVHPEEDPIFAERYTLNPGEGSKTFITPEWQYIAHFPSGAEELYDRRTDRQDLHNLAASPTLRPQLERFRKRLHSILPNLPKPGGPTP